MGYTLAQFSDACHRVLADDTGTKGRKKVCALVQDVLKDDAFVAAHLGDDVPERKNASGSGASSAFSAMSTTVPRK